MKIAFVVHDLDCALGHGRYTYELARRFCRSHDVHVFANTFRIPDGDPIHRHHVPALRQNALASILSFVLPATFEVGRDFDIVHAQGLTSLRFNVVTAHICNAAWAQAQRPAGVARTRRQQLFEAIVTPLERAMYRRSRSAEVIAISARVQSDLARFYGRSERVHVIHHGIDPAVFSPHSRPLYRASVRAELGLRDNAVAALFVGDLRKGAEVALAALARVPELRLVLVSRSDAEPYERRARELGVTDRVVFRPPTTHIEQYYAAADIFLFPSPYDAFGMVVSEAMASGLPVITSRAAGASELIRHGESGFIVEEHDDVGAIAAYLAELTSDDARRPEIGRAARRAAESGTWDAVADRTMEVYRRAIGTSAATAS